jgi:hypothetical protein
LANQEARQQRRAFLQIVRNGVYLATRSLAICVPICEKAAAIWLA